MALEFLDFYLKDNKKKDNKLRYVVFDSKLTNYENLRCLDKDGVMFITIRRRGKLIIDRIATLPENGWSNVRVECAGNKHRRLRVYDEVVHLAIYEKQIRQITITGNGKIKPAIIINNDFDLSMSILAYNLYRLLALKLERYSNMTAQRLYDKFILNSADINIEDITIIVNLFARNDYGNWLSGRCGKWHAISSMGKPQPYRVFAQGFCNGR